MTIGLKGIFSFAFLIYGILAIDYDKGFITGNDFQKYFL